MHKKVVHGIIDPVVMALCPRAGVGIAFGLLKRAYLFLGRYHHRLDTQPLSP